MAKPLSRSDLMSLEQYAQQRNAFRSQLIAHKKPRRVGIGPHFFLYFEDRQTIQYQIQEMLRIEKIFESAGIEEELETYNPLIPDGKNLKATAMLEYQDVEVRKQQLALLKGIEHLVWIQIEDFDRVFSISNEDLPRSNEEKTSAVHFMRFEFDSNMITALRNGASLTMGTSHESYSHSTVASSETVTSLLADFT
jgi:hypothetical protein